MSDEERAEHREMETDSMPGTMKTQPIATPNPKQVKETNKAHVKSMRVVKRERSSRC